MAILQNDPTVERIETGGITSVKEFVFEDTVITDASLDETGRFIVNPVEYYGDAYLNACK